MHKLKATRSEAVAFGQEFYFTGLPCKRGHVAKRRTINSACQECNALRTKEDRKRVQLLAKK